MSEQASSVGIGPALGILFVGLKLTHFINWSWWWVLAPFWGTFLLMFLSASINERSRSRRKSAR